MAELMPELTTEPLKAGGELLLFALFVLFSVGSALLERRKRKKQAEKGGQASSVPGGPLTDEKQEEETGSWPFPMGGDPFDLPKPKQRPARRPLPDGGGQVVAGPQPTAPAQSAPAPRRSHIEQMEEEAREVKRLQETEAGDSYGEAARPDPLEELERLALEAELRARGVEEAARATERQAQQVQQVQPRRRVRELVQERIELDQEQRARKKRRPKWLLTPKTARDAVVYTVILGRPKADREGEDYR
ncbi:MAG: hypothetical protein IH889_08845 [Planctomycetes bacterium]|nr:hypothetical protein [Planctomycetota bacterium]